MSGKWGIIGQVESKGLNTFVGNFALPCIIFTALAELDFRYIQVHCINETLAETSLNSFDVFTYIFQSSQLDVSDGHFDQQSGRVCGRRNIHASVDQTDEFLQSRTLCHFLHAEQRFRPGIPDRLVGASSSLYIYNQIAVTPATVWLNGDVTSARKNTDE